MQQSHFEQLAIIQLELTNVGNRDFQTFPFAITLPIKNTIIGIQYEGEGRLHKATFSPEINIDNPSPQVDILLEPFNRKEKYSISFVINASEKELEKNIQLDKVLPITFVSIDWQKYARPNFFLSVSFPMFIFILITLSGFMDKPFAPIKDFLSRQQPITFWIFTH